MKIYIKSIIVIVSICLVMGFLLALVYSVTSPVIAENEEKTKQEALQTLFPDAVQFTDIDVPDGAPKVITAMVNVDGGTYYVVYLSISTGYTTGETTFVMGYNPASKTITELKFLSYNESVPCGDAFPASFSNQTQALADVDASASPAVYTRKAVKDAVNEALVFLAENIKVRGVDDGN